MLASGWGFPLPPASVVEPALAALSEPQPVAARAPSSSRSGDALVSQTESLHMSWFATSGSFVHDRTGVAGADALTTTSTANSWKAPAEATDVVYLWLVLRDSRGGTAFKSYTIHVGQ